ncbi:MAG: ABC transporter ATP-binding protein [Betaproteobacteria bacterium]
MSAPILEIENVSLAFGGVRAIDGLSLRVEPGEVFAIIGPNGAGKTSVFNVITRVFDPLSGAVRVMGRDMLALRRHEVVHAGVARTFQNIELFDGASVLDNLMLGRHRFAQGGFFAQCLRMPSVVEAEAQARERIEDIIELLDLAAWRHAPVAGLPYGVRKVVELARALAAEPKLLLLDEPASGLNPEETRDLSFWIDDIRHDLGITVVMVEHDMSLVARAADRVLCMNQGAARSLGRPAEVQSDPKVVAAYLGA